VLAGRSAAWKEAVRRRASRGPQDEKAKKAALRKAEKAKLIKDLFGPQKGRGHGITLNN
jgi:hypothetical protein